LEQVVEEAHVTQPSMLQLKLQLCPSVANEKPSLHLRQVADVAHRRQLAMLQMGAQLLEDTLNPSLQARQAVAEPQTAQLLILQLGTHCVLAALVVKRSIQVSQVLAVAHFAQKLIWQISVAQ
jgi:hypothetical protein